MPTSLLLPSSGSYCLVVKGISYFKDYHKKWKDIEAKNKYMNIKKLYVILI